MVLRRVGFGSSPRSPHPPVLHLPYAAACKHRTGLSNQPLGSKPASNSTSYQTGQATDPIHIPHYPGFDAVRGPLGPGPPSRGELASGFFSLVCQVTGPSVFFLSLPILSRPVADWLGRGNPALNLFPPTTPHQDGSFPSQLSAWKEFCQPICCRKANRTRT